MSSTRSESVSEQRRASATANQSNRTDSILEPRRSSTSSNQSSNSSSSTSQDYRLDLFGRHIPHVLAVQLVAKLVDQFINQSADNDADQVGAFSCTPSITRFDAALLFVDISGFTVLSQRLPVDELRLCINNYFKIILDRVIANNGDVVKFAGDALFIIWRVDQEMHDENDKQKGMRDAVARAIKCGMEINNLCTNYRVDFKKRNHEENEDIATLILQRNGEAVVDETGAVAPSSETKSSSNVEEDHTFLNVHSGCAAGTFAGVDVGASDRWEYLILGQPIQDVADAESAAHKGELVLSAAAHGSICTGGIVHPSLEEGVHETKVEPQYLEEGDSVTPCGCIKTANGCFRLNQSRALSIMEYPQVSESEEEEEDELTKDDYEFTYYRRTVAMAMKAFKSSKERIMLMFGQYLQELEAPPPITTANSSSGESESKKNLLQSSSLPTLPSSAKDPLFQQTQAEQFVYDYFLKWLISCLTSDFARHVHEADRLDFQMTKISRINCLQQCAKDYRLAKASGQFEDLGPIELTSASRDSTVSDSFVRRIRSLVSNASTSRLSAVSGNAGNNNNNFLREKNQKKHEKLLRKDRELTGELRNVIVMFIAIKSEAKELIIDPPEEERPQEDACSFSAFHFLARTAAERDGDLKLKKHYQTCMSLIVMALKEKGGQLRQFIVDDKGTVAIGSFGLRGSANYDNAASAVEAALNIILHLQNVGLNCSIGITTGKVYCGVVGSVKRHEYALMGPSVNLSARLMGQAKAGEIICDVSTRSVDRLHSFRAVGEVKAKGYANLVPIFKPVFNRGSILHFATRNSSLVDQIPAEHLPSAEPTPRRQGSDLDLGADESKAINHSATSDFPSSNATAMPFLSIKKRPFVGREAEELEVIQIILRDMLESDDPAMPSSAINLLQVGKEVQATHHIEQTSFPEVGLNTACPSRIIVVHGASGIGKSALISSICDKFHHYGKKANWNVQIVHGKSSSLTMNDPFKPWHVIIRTIFAQLSRYENIVHSTREPEKVEHSDRTAVVKRWLKGVHYLTSYLTEEEKTWLPLLTSAHIIPGLEDNEVTSKLTGQQRLEVIVKLLRAIVAQYPILTNKVLMIVLDDSHFMDLHSWSLVHQILDLNKGVIFLAGYYNATEEVRLGGETEEKESSSSELPDGSNKGSSNLTTSTTLHETLFARPACRQITLGGLAGAAIRDLMSHIFEGVDVKDMPQGMVDILEEMTGGNPLFLYEIATATFEKMKSHSIDQNIPLTDMVKPRGPEQRCVFEEFLKGFRANRIDEVIYYRFDRLDQLSQLILKLGSVVTISNSHRGFTLEMIMHLLGGEGKVDAGVEEHSPLHGLFSCVDLNNNLKSDYLQACEKISQKLHEMVNHHQFIKIIRTRRRSSFTDSSRETTLQEQIKNFHSRSQEHIPLGGSNQDEEVDEERLHREMVEICYDFNVTLERKTIYELMLEDQKESLHDRVASSLEIENEDSHHRKYLTFSDLNEEAYHWEKATVWGSAMACYYRAGMLLDALGALKEAYQYFSNAFRMLARLRRDAKIQESAYNSIKFESLLSEFEFLNRSAADRPLSEEAVDGWFSQKYSLQGNNNFSLTKIDVYNTFGGDANLLEVAIHLLVKFGQTNFTLNESVAVTSRIYEDALRLMLLSWPRVHNHVPVGTTETEVEAATAVIHSRLVQKRSKPRNLTLSTFSTSSKDSLDEGAASSRGGGPPQNALARMAEVQALMDNFKLKDPSICFPILAGMATLYRTRRLPDDAEHSKERCLYQIMLNFSQTAPEHYRIHFLQGSCLMSSLHLELGEYEEAINRVPLIRRYHQPEIHSAELVKIYGNDRIPFTIAVVAQYLTLFGYLTHAKRIIFYLENIVLPGMSHLHSMGTLSIPLTAIHVLLEEYEAAEKAFSLYRQTELARVGAYSFFKEANVIISDYFQVKQFYLKQDYETLYQLLFFCTPQARHTEMTPSTTIQSCGYLLELLEKILAKKYLYKENRPLIFDAILSFGLPLEFLCADLLLMIVDTLNRRSKQAEYADEVSPFSPRELLTLADEYCEVSLAQTKVGRRYMVAHMVVLFVKLKIRLLMIHLAPVGSDQRKEDILVLKQDLQDMLDYVDRDGFALVAVLLVKNLNDKLCKQVQCESVVRDYFLQIFHYPSEQLDEGAPIFNQLAKLVLERVRTKNLEFLENPVFEDLHKIIEEKVPNRETWPSLQEDYLREILAVGEK